MRLPRAIKRLGVQQAEIIVLADVHIGTGDPITVLVAEQGWIRQPSAGRDIANWYETHVRGEPIERGSALLQ